MWRFNWRAFTLGNIQPGLKPFIEDWAILMYSAITVRFFDGMTDFAAHPSSPGPALGADRLALRSCRYGPRQPSDLCKRAWGLEVVVPESDYKSASTWPLDVVLGTIASSDALSATPEGSGLLRPISL